MGRARGRLGGVRGGELPGAESAPGRRRPTARCSSGDQDRAQGCSPRASAAEVLADIRDRGAQFGVADLYREHRVLKVGQRVVGGADLGDRPIDLRAGVPVTGGGLRERTGWHAGTRETNPSWARCARPKASCTARNSSFSRRPAMASSSVCRQRRGRRGRRPGARQPRPCGRESAGGHPRPCKPYAVYSGRTTTPAGRAGNSSFSRRPAMASSSVS